MGLIIAYFLIFIFIIISIIKEHRT